MATESTLHILSYRRQATPALSDKFCSIS
jgi:hypothetical protein